MWRCISSFPQRIRRYRIGLSTLKLQSTFLFFKGANKSACQLLPLLFKNVPIRVAQIACCQTVTTDCLDNSRSRGKGNQIVTFLRLSDGRTWTPTPILPLQLLRKALRLYITYCTVCNNYNPALENSLCRAEISPHCPYMILHWFIIQNILQIFFHRKHLDMCQLLKCLWTW